METKFEASEKGTKKRLISIEMKYFKRTAGYTLFSTYEMKKFWNS